MVVEVTVVGPFILRRLAFNLELEGGGMIKEVGLRDEGSRAGCDSLKTMIDPSSFTSSDSALT